MCAGVDFVTYSGEGHFAPAFINLETIAIHGFDWEPCCWRAGATYFSGSAPERLKYLLMARHRISQHWDKDANYTERQYGPPSRMTLHIVTERGQMIATVLIGGEERKP